MQEPTESDGEAPAEGGRIGPLLFAPGVSTFNGGSFLFASVFIIFLLTFMNFGQSFILGQHLGIPEEDHGKTAGMLATIGEIIFLTLAGVIGLSIDRFGRRFIFVGGMVVLGVAYFLYPTATTLPELMAYRVVFGIGAVMASTALVTVQADYPLESTRGKFVAVSALLNGLGLMVLAGFLGRLPKKLIDQGADPVSAGTTAYWIVAGIAVMTAIILMVGLKGGAPVRQSARRREKVLRLLGRGFAAARGNSRITLAYVAAFASRGDIVVVGIFISQWLITYSAEQGIAPDVALVRATMLFIVIQGSALLYAPIHGILTDRLNRVMGLAIAMGIAAVGYLGTILIADPYGPLIMIVGVVVGAGQVATIIAGQTLIGQEAPADERGAIMGVFTFCGALGIIFATAFGGYLFDAWRYAGPFILLGGANFLILLYALVVNRRRA